MILIILSISSVSNNSLTQYQQKYIGGRGQINSVCHDRKMMVMCPLSSPDSNTAIILFGASCWEIFFEFDISLQDNSQIRKLKYHSNTYFSSKPNKMFFGLSLSLYIYIYIYMHRSWINDYVG